MYTLWQVLTAQDLALCGKAEEELHGNLHLSLFLAGLQELRHFLNSRFASLLRGLLGKRLRGPSATKTAAIEARDNPEPPAERHQGQAERHSQDPNGDPQGESCDEEALIQGECEEDDDQDLVPQVSGQELGMVGSGLGDEVEEQPAQTCGDHEKPVGALAADLGRERGHTACECLDNTAVVQLLCGVNVDLRGLEDGGDMGHVELMLCQVRHVLAVVHGTDLIHDICGVVRDDKIVGVREAAPRADRQKHP
mmetsp:Transcript_15067/g.31488  ORF Transcript_15067/g.31488 Transcript_15067/m.31488 type:complete len:252 (-) Transcript_15067:393-1148(-)